MEHIEMCCFNVNALVIIIITITIQTICTTGAFLLIMTNTLQMMLLFILIVTPIAKSK